MRQLLPSYIFTLVIFVCAIIFINPTVWEYLENEIEDSWTRAIIVSAMIALTGFFFAVLYIRSHPSLGRGVCFDVVCARSSIVLITPLRRSEREVEVARFQPWVVIEVAGVVLVVVPQRVVAMPRSVARERPC